MTGRDRCAAVAANVVPASLRAAIASVPVTCPSPLLPPPPATLPPPASLPPPPSSPLPFPRPHCPPPLLPSFLLDNPNPLR